MYVRLTRTVADKGKLVNPSELMDLIDDFDIDWYYSPFEYGEDALEYFEKNKYSIKGYTGKATTKVLYWDLDCKDDFDKVRLSALNLIDLLTSMGLRDSIEVYFSGNKGLHILLHTNTEFNPQQVRKICQNLAVEAQVDINVFDTSVYNVNRIFRVPLTKHQSSGLYKILLYPESLEELSEAEIREAAKYQEGVAAEYDIVESDCEWLIEEYGQIVDPKVSDKSEIDTAREIYGEDFNPMDCPPDKRRCIYVLENGFFGPGERENATIRLVAYHKGQGKTREETKQIILEAYEKRQHNYHELNPWNESDIDRNIEQVYSPNWNGGTYSCKTDEYLKSKCDLGAGCCANDKENKLNIVTINGLFNQYEQYGDEALKEYPKTGIEWLDSNVRLRPKNFSIINAANGAGKTSLAILMMEELNRMKMYHVFFSLDMADTSLFEKLGARHTSYSQKEIEVAFNKHTRNPKIIEEVKKVLSDTYKYTLFDFTSTVNSEYIENTILTLKNREIDPINVQVIFIDYAGRLIGDKDSEYANATQIALQANDICKSANVHAVYLSQIPREDGDHTVAIRSSRVSKNSGAWEENATVVINCWRPFGDGTVRDSDKYMHIYIAKNRSGPLGERVFHWEGRTGDIRELENIEYAEYVRLCEKEGKDTPKHQHAYGSNEEAAIRKGIFGTEKIKGSVQFNMEDEFQADPEFQDNEEEIKETKQAYAKRDKMSSHKGPRFGSGSNRIFNPRKS